MTIAPPNMQGSLFYLPPQLSAKCNASARNAYGTAAQEIACKTLQLNPIPINGNFDVCFDAEKDNTFYEIKSVNRKGKIVMYDWRMSKEERSGLPLLYCVVIHNLRGARKDILAAMVESKIIIVLISSTIIHQLALACPLQTLNKPLTTNKRNGYTRKGYCDGYRNLSVTTLLNQPLETTKINSPFNHDQFTLCKSPSLKS